MEGEIFFLDGPRHFGNEAEFREILKSYLNKAIKDYYIVTSLNVEIRHPAIPNYKPKPYLAFRISDTTFRIDFPTMKLMHGRKSQLLSWNDYGNKNRQYFRDQIDKHILIVQQGIPENACIKVTDNIFENITPRVVGDQIETVFDDPQALRLCKKISSPLTRRLLREARKDFSPVHRMAMKCFRKYGGHVVTFLLSLPDLKFGDQNSSLLTNRFPYAGEIPSLKIKMPNGVEYFICFHEPRKRFGKPTTVATIYNKHIRISEGYLTAQGYLEARINAERVTLHVFVDNLKNPKSIFMGAELGKCIFCNKELTDIKSLRNGYGKDCAQSYGLDYQ